MLPAWLSIALIAAVSRGGEPETQFAGNRERCITRYYDLSYEVRLDLLEQEDLSN